MSKSLNLIRNFSIIAHIDHGKSTLADRLIQRTGGLTEREMTRGQVLDNMEIEQERGITIKAQTVRLKWKAADGEIYELNLMDTPGHVDFAYEVSRSLAACEGALLVVDAAQGVEAQTLANVYQSIEHDHEIVPVINKIDLPAAEPEKVREEIEEIIGLDASGAVLASAKSGIGIDEVLQAIVDKIPPPRGDREAPLKAMLVDSWYDPYLGVVVLVRVMDGVLKKGAQIKFMQAGTVHLVDRVGCNTPKIEQLEELGPGEIGFITAQIKEISEARVGDTITEADVRLFTTLVRFDPVYHGHFKCNRSKLTEMPVLWAYARDLFQTPGFGDTIDFVQIKQHYYIVHTDINPTKIVPKGPDLVNWLTPHDREALGGRPFGDGTPPGPPREGERVPVAHSAG